MKTDSGITIKPYLELSRLKIMLPVSFTGFTGYFIFDPHFSFRLLLVTTGILLMAISASVLNQIQETETDSKMNRTQNRPLPAGKINLNRAIVFFFFNLVAGTIIIYLAGNAKATLIGFTTIFWYNGIYTCLKKITPFAIFPGAVTGALPPLIGWVAAGGDVWDKPVVFLEFLIFTGQIPHFWLLLSKYGEEYKSAGFPNLTDLISRNQINRLTFTWVLSSVAAAIFLSLFEIIQTGLLTGILLTGSVFIIWQFSGLIRNSNKNNDYRKYSIILNSYFFLILVILISDRIIS